MARGQAVASPRTPRVQECREDHFPDLTVRGVQLSGQPRTIAVVHKREHRGLRGFGTGSRGAACRRSRWPQARALGPRGLVVVAVLRHRPDGCQLPQAVQDVRGGDARSCAQLLRTAHWGTGRQTGLALDLPLELCTGGAPAASPGWLTDVVAGSLTRGLLERRERTLRDEARALADDLAVQQRLLHLVVVETGLDPLGVKERLENGVVLLLRFLAGLVLAAGRQVGDGLHDLRGLHVPGRQLVRAVGPVELLEERLVLFPQRHHFLRVEVGRCRGHVEEVRHVIPFEELPLPWVAEHLLRQEVLVHLPLVDLLLDAPGQHQPVHRHVPALANAPGALSGLHVSHWIPVGIEYDHAVSTNDVQADTPNSRRQNHGKKVHVRIELLNQFQPPLHGCLAVNAEVRVGHRVHPGLDDLQHLDGLHEDEHAVALFAPELHDLREDLHLSGPLEAPHVGGLELLICVEEQEVRVVAELAEHADGEEDGADVLLLSRCGHRAPHLLRLQEVNVHLVLLVRQVAEQNLLLLVR
mmetsp:Transcript_40125/g.120083  ORF Transcript_40125/g.120083 Transcript_40125/m.120083 type:complete len:526 (+) Transcript_40125:215-1792(+)